jgi:hypothetical protein
MAIRAGGRGARGLREEKNRGRGFRFWCVAAGGGFKPEGEIRRSIEAEEAKWRLREKEEGTVGCPPTRAKAAAKAGPPPRAFRSGL